MLRAILPTIYSLTTRIYSDRLNQFYVLEAHAQSRSHGSRTLLIYQGRSYTYAEVYDRALRYGAWLRERHGVRPGDMVALDCMNSDVFVFVWFGLWAIGAKPAFINYNLTGAPLVHCVKKAGTRVMLIDPEIASNVSPEVKKDLEGMEFVTLSEDVVREAEHTHPTRYPDADRAEDKKLSRMAILIYTSGTTGLPKAAIVSWGKSITAPGFVHRWLARTPSDVLYTCMPLYHSSAAILGLISTLEAGGTISLGRKFSTKTFWADVRASNASIIQYVGETCRYLLAAPAEVIDGENMDRKHGVRVAFGNGLRPDVWNPFKDRFGIDTIAEWYASTEGTLATFNLSRNDFSAGAIGRNGMVYKYLLGRTIALISVDAETDTPRRNKKNLCSRVRSRVPGELVFRIPAADTASRFQGYYGDAAATDAKIIRDVFCKGDAWFRTGDVMRWDGDGLLYFSDRLGDTFRWKSENVSTAEVAGVIGGFGGVREAVVYGVEVRGYEGRAGCVALVLEGGGKEEEEEVMEGLGGFLEGRLPRYARPVFARVLRGGEGGWRLRGR